MSSPTGSSQWFANPGADFYNGATSTSLRFNSGSSQFLSQTLGTTNRRTFTFSVWMKRTTLGAVQNIFSGGAGSSQNDYWFGFTAADLLQFQNITGNSYNARIITTRKFRDTSAWYNFVLSVDSTIEDSGTVIDRVRLYVNGVRETVTVNTQLANDALTAVNLSGSHKIGVLSYGDPFQYLDGYLADANFVDGTSLEPAAFGELKNGVWIPRNPSPTYGTNGYRLQFTSTTHDAPANNGSADTDNIGADSSGENNHFTAADAIVASDCAMPDSPENNFCTLNRLANFNFGSNHASVHTEGNLKAVNSGTNISHLYGNFRINDFLTNGCYFEARVVSIDNDRFAFGVIDPLSWTGAAVAFYQNAKKAIMNHLNSIYSNDNVAGYVTFTPDTATTIVANDIIGVAIKGDDVWFHVNGVYTRNASDALGNPSNGANPAITAITDIAGTDYFPYFGYASSYHVNFGQDPTFKGYLDGSTSALAPGTETADEGAGVFKFAVPTGFQAMCSANLPEPLIGANSDTQANDHMQAVIYEGSDANSGVQNIAVNFQPDLTWIKNRDATDPHQLFDSSRGATFPFSVHDALKGDIANDDTLTDFIATGFTLGDDVAVNTDDESYVSWNWKANGGTSTGNGAESSGNPKFDHQSNTLAGFSIVEYEGTGANGTFAHGVKVNDVATAPAVIWFKHIQGEDSWAMWHHQGTTNDSQYIPFSTANASPQGDTNLWNTGVPSATIINLGVNSLVNRNLGSPSGQGKFICYCFAEIEGYSKFGTYIGNNNADGSFVYTGFRPAYVLTKINNGGTGNWYINDTARDPGNITTPLYNDLNNAETGNGIDILSNGFKLRNADGSQNAAVKYLYMAFAEESFKYANAR